MTFNRGLNPGIHRLFWQSHYTDRGSGELHIPMEYAYTLILHMAACISKKLRIFTFLGNDYGEFLIFLDNFELKIKKKLQFYDLETYLLTKSLFLSKKSSFASLWHQTDICLVLKNKSTHFRCTILFRTSAVVGIFLSFEDYFEISKTFQHIL